MQPTMLVICDFPQSFQANAGTASMHNVRILTRYCCEASLRVLTRTPSYADHFIEKDV